jgi:hypothetical protein
MCERSAAQEEVVALLDLLERVVVVIPKPNIRPLRSRLPKAAVVVTYEVTGMSPQSMTLAQELNGFAASGTLYPPLNPILREPLDITQK